MALNPRMEGDKVIIVSVSDYNTHVPEFMYISTHVSMLLTEPEWRALVLKVDKLFAARTLEGLKGPAS